MAKSYEEFRKKMSPERRARNDAKTKDLLEVFPPGEYLKDELEARGWSAQKFANIVGCDSALVDRIISGTEPITPRRARMREEGLGVSAQCWLNLEAVYRGT